MSFLARLALCAGGAIVCILMLGPFQGAERHFGLNDFAAHVIAFYGLACLCFMAGPRLRRNDLALVLLAVGAASEVAQAMVGRSASFQDLAADGLGVLTAWLPSQIETLRSRVRQQHGRPMRRRSDRGATSPGAQRPPAVAAAGLGADLRASSSTLSRQASSAHS